MKTMLSKDKKVEKEIFDIATQLYVRLRRIAGRVIDVVYLEHNLEYAQEVVKLALTTGDAELHRLGSRLDAILSGGTVATQVANVKFVAPVGASSPALDDLPTPVLKEEVPHHYIGALR
ncbi:hypothetical protein [Acinetobacter sp. MB5]|uniref:hypothetical protein n=1 Tax=Acinetobacter sp. MB5 TaxID=2069438 RepID=UPI000DD00462|nr:hypothetical protein [Acinetobacter sp. MB5]